jgi:hypothetical protein
MSANTFQQLHACISDINEITLTLSTFNETVLSVGLYFKLDVSDEDGGIAYPINEIPNNAIVVLGSFDFSYYHQVEIVFFDTIAHTIDSEYRWSDHWDKDQLCLLSSAERNKIIITSGIADDPSIRVFAFNIGSFSDEQYYIIAKGISIKMGIVFHYDRAAQEPLKENERVAYWVHTASK